MDKSVEFFLMKNHSKNGTVESKSHEALILRKKLEKISNKHLWVIDI
jgi:hypothetical protein